MLAQQRPPALSGFEQIKRYWDPLNQCWMAKILPGEFYVSEGDNEVITTTLGSCVSACIWDPQRGIGGMNHFMLPLSPRHHDELLPGAAARYGSYAMEFLINAILNAGGSKPQLRMKICGGANLIDAGASLIGQRNAEFVLQFAKQDKLTVVSSDLGKSLPRKVMFYPQSGRLRIKTLGGLTHATVVKQDQQYQAELVNEPLAGDIELFV